MTSRITRIVSVTGLSVVLMLSALLPSFAGSEGRRNTALVLTALTVNQAMRRDDRGALILGLASAAAWNSYEDSLYRDRRYYSYRSDCRRDNDYRYRSDCRRDNDYRYRSDYRRDNNYQYRTVYRSDRGKCESDQRKYDRSRPKGHAYGLYKRGGHR